MEDLAHFIQSMSEKYGLLDASHKQYQPGANSSSNNDNNNQRQLLQDHTSSAASNTLNSEECPGSSWECLSIFVSGSQSIDCKNAPPGPYHALPALAYPQRPPQQQGDNSSTRSPTLDSFSKLIDVDEHECPPLYNFGKGSTNYQQQQQELPGIDLTSQLGASSNSTDLVEGGFIFDGCGDRSSVVTMPDYIQQCCSYLGDNNRVDRTQLDTRLDTSFCPTASLTKNSGHAQQLQQPAKNAAAASNSTSNSTAVQQEVHSTKGNEGFGEMLLSNSRSLLCQEDRNLSEQRPAIGMVAASGQGQGQEQQTPRARDRSRLGLSSTSAGLNYIEAESGEIDMIVLHEYDILRGRTTRDAHLGNATEGCGHEEAYQNGLKDGTKGMVKTTSGGRSSSRGERHAAASDAPAAQPFDGFPSFNPGEHQKRGIQATSGCSCSSTEMLPLPAENGHQNQQGKNGAAASSSSSSSPDYLPISTAMESKVAQLDEASKELFASSWNGAQNFNFENENENGAFRRNSSTSSDKPPALKKARSFRDLHAGTDGKEDRSLQKSNTATSVKNNSGDLGSNCNQQPRVFVAKSRSLPDNPYSSVEGANSGAKAPKIGEKDEDLLKAAGLDGVCEPKWSQINKLLNENGFSPVNWQLITSTTEIADKFFYTLNSVVGDYKRREKEVQELLAERETLRQEEKLSNEIMQKLEYEVELVKRKLATSEQRAEMANAAAEKTCALLRKDNQRLEASHARMLQRCSQLEHGSRAKERALRKLQEKVQEAVQREERQRQKEKELYEKLKHKIAIGQKSQGEVIESNFLLRDLKPATIVGVYERQRARAQVEMNSLREENSRLCQELCEKENSLLSKANSIAGGIAQSGFDKREHKIFQQLTQIDNILKMKTSCSRKMAPGEDTALLALIDTAPGGKSHRALQETSRNELDLNSSSALLAQNLNECTSFKCQEFLRGICNLLKVAEPARITGAIDGLLKVVAAVPRMETFIEQVCDIVFNDDAMMLARDRTSDLQETPAAVPGLLKSWLEKLQCLEDLQQFKDSVSTQLWERFDEKAIQHPMTSRVAAASVKDLIETERQYLLSQASYGEGDIILKAEPQKLPHCIIKHFQMLFEIPKLEGVMAVMNSLYIQISEYHNFSRALCSMLGLPKDARPNSIISTMTSILNKVETHRAKTMEEVGDISTTSLLSGIQVGEVRRCIRYDQYVNCGTFKINAPLLRRLDICMILAAVGRSYRTNVSKLKYPGKGSSLASAVQSQFGFTKTSFWTEYQYRGIMSWKIWFNRNVVIFSPVAPRVAPYGVENLARVAHSYAMDGRRALQKLQDTIPIQIRQQISKLASIWGSSPLGPQNLYKTVILSPIPAASFLWNP